VQDAELRRRRVLKKLDSSTKFDTKIVIVAGIGFLIDAYDIFAISSITPMLAFVYEDEVSRNECLRALQVSTLIGIFLGQVGFGILADVIGRRKVYGLTLAINIMGTLGLTTAASGFNSSMSLIGWLVFWRLVMGIGIGVDCKFYIAKRVLTCQIRLVPLLLLSLLRSSIEDGCLQPCFLHSLLANLLQLVSH
jgi:PHS family inorganic phosphate transporter-like MFS transporter